MMDCGAQALKLHGHASGSWTLGDPKQEKIKS